MKTLACIVAVGFGSIALVLACDSSSETPSTNNANDGGGTRDAPSSSGGDLDCTKHRMVDTRPKCDQCTKQRCCYEIMVCESEPDCQALQDCIAPCADGDSPCVKACNDKHTNGSEPLIQLGQCAFQKCTDDCPLPDAGAFDTGTD
jgi:hypothetical protein